MATQAIFHKLVRIYGLPPCHGIRYICGRVSQPFTMEHREWAVPFWYCSNPLFLFFRQTRSESNSLVNALSIHSQRVEIGLLFCIVSLGGSMLTSTYYLTNNFLLVLFMHIIQNSKVLWFVKVGTQTGYRIILYHSEDTLCCFSRFILNGQDKSQFFHLLQQTRNVDFDTVAKARMYHQLFPSHNSILFYNDRVLMNASTLKAWSLEVMLLLFRILQAKPKRIKVVRSKNDMPRKQAYTKKL